MRKIRVTQNGQVQYQLCGVNKIWGGVLRLEWFTVTQDGGTQFIPFNSARAAMEIIYLAMHDGGDLSGFDSRYNLSNHSSTHFCTYVMLMTKIKL